MHFHNASLNQVREKKMGGWRGTMHHSLDILWNRPGFFSWSVHFVSVNFSLQLPWPKKVRAVAFFYASLVVDCAFAGINSRIFSYIAEAKVIRIYYFSLFLHSLHHSLRSNRIHFLLLFYYQWNSLNLTKIFRYLKKKEKNLGKNREANINRNCKRSKSRDLNYGNLKRSYRRILHGTGEKKKKKER